MGGGGLCNLGTSQHAVKMQYETKFYNLWDEMFLKENSGCTACEIFSKHDLNRNTINLAGLI